MSYNELHKLWKKNPKTAAPIISQQTRYNDLESIDKELSDLAQKRIELEESPLPKVKLMSCKEMKQKFDDEQVKQMLSALKQKIHKQPDNKKRFTDMISKIFEIIL